MSRKPSLFRRLLCRIGLCAGWPDHEKDADGIWWFGLRCVHCGKLKCKKESMYQDTK